MESCSLTGQAGKTLRVEVGSDMQRFLKFPPVQSEGKCLTNKSKIKQEKNGTQQGQTHMLDILL